MDRVSVATQLLPHLAPLVLLVRYPFDGCGARCRQDVRIRKRLTPIPNPWCCCTSKGTCKLPTEVRKEGTSSRVNNNPVLLTPVDLHDGWMDPDRNTMCNLNHLSRRPLRAIVGRIVDWEGGEGDKSTL